MVHFCTVRVVMLEYVGVFFEFPAKFFYPVFVVVGVVYQFYETAQKEGSKVFWTE